MSPMDPIRRELWLFHVFPCIAVGNCRKVRVGNIQHARHLNHRMLFEQLPGKDNVMFRQFGVVPAAYILGMGHRLKMVGINAATIATKMVKLQVWVNCAMVLLVDIAMSFHRIVVYSGNSVASRVGFSIPYPAPCIRVNGICQVSRKMTSKEPQGFASHNTFAIQALPGYGCRVATSTLTQSRWVWPFAFLVRLPMRMTIDVPKVFSCDIPLSAIALSRNWRRFSTSALAQSRWVRWGCSVYLVFMTGYVLKWFALYCPLASVCLSCDGGGLAATAQTQTRRVRFSDCLASIGCLTRAASFGLSVHSCSTINTGFAILTGHLADLLDRSSEVSRRGLLPAAPRHLRTLIIPHLWGFCAKGAVI